MSFIEEESDKVFDETRLKISSNVTKAPEFPDEIYLVKTDVLKSNTAKFDDAARTEQDAELLSLVKGLAISASTTPKNHEGIKGVYINDLETALNSKASKVCSSSNPTESVDIRLSEKETGRKLQGSEMKNTEKPLSKRQKKKLEQEQRRLDNLLPISTVSVRTNITRNDSPESDEPNMDKSALDADIVDGKTLPLKLARGGQENPKQNVTKELIEDIMIESNELNQLVPAIEINDSSHFEKERPAHDITESDLSDKSSVFTKKNATPSDVGSPVHTEQQLVLDTESDADSSILLEVAEPTISPIAALRELVLENGLSGSSFFKLPLIWDTNFQFTEEELLLGEKNLAGRLPEMIDIHLEADDRFISDKDVDEFLEGELSSRSHMSLERATNIFEAASKRLETMERKLEKLIKRNRKQANLVFV